MGDLEKEVVELVCSINKKLKDKDVTPQRRSEFFDLLAAVVQHEAEHTRWLNETIGD